MRKIPTTISFSQNHPNPVSNNACYQSVWTGFGTWLRTIRKNTLPSEMVTALAMTRAYDDFLEDEQDTIIFKKFLVEKIADRKLRYQAPAIAEAA